MRMRALKTMNRAHSVMRKSAPFPLSAVAKMLAFQNDRKVSLTCIEKEIVECRKLSLIRERDRRVDGCCIRGSPNSKKSCSHFGNIEHCDCLKGVGCTHQQ